MLFGVRNYGALKRNGYTARKIDGELLTYADVQDDVAKLYRKSYWDKCKCDNLPWYLNCYVFDMAVNSGPGNAVRTLQKMLDVVVDGDIGPKTLAVAAKFPHAKYNDFMQLRQAFYNNIVARDPSQKKFINGWTNRIARLQSFAESAS
jgi:lysozyme family protein